MSILRMLVCSPIFIAGALTAILFRLFKKKPKYGSESRVKLVESVAKMLEMQRTVSGNKPIVNSAGRPNRKAMGYIYGFVDAALDSIGQDISDISIGMPTVFGVFCYLYPGKELEYTDYLLDHVGKDETVMTGVASGGQQYTDLISGRKSSPMQFGLFLLNGDEY